MQRQIILGAIVILALALRLYRVTLVPPSLYWDEASIAYNAYSINQTGKDEWGVPYPLSFRSFGDYKLPMYVYLTAVSEKIFGLNEFAVRIPSVLAGTLTVLFLFLFLSELVPYLGSSGADRRFLFLVPYVGAFLLATSPWALQFSRAGFEASVSVMFRVLGLWLFFLAMRRDLRLLFLAGPTFVASVYTYYSALLVAPGVLLCLTVMFWPKLLANWKTVGLAIIFCLLLIAPYVPTYLTSANGRLRFSSESVTHQKGPLITNLVNNYVANFSLDYLFFHGDQEGRHSVKKLGELYLWELPVVLAGLYWLIKQKSLAAWLPIIFILIAAVPPAITRVSPHALRGHFGEVGWAIIAAVGLSYLLFRARRFLGPAALMVICFSFLLYLHVYYIHYPKAYAADWQDGQKQAVLYLKSVADKYDQIFLTSDLYPVYLQLYLPYDPKFLQESNHDLTRLGKYTYADLTKAPVKDNPAKTSLIVAPSWMGSTTLTSLGNIYMSNGDIAFRVYEY